METKGIEEEHGLKVLAIMPSDVDVIPADGMEQSCRLDIAKTSARMGYTGHVVFASPQYCVYDRFCIEDVLSRSRPN